MSSSALTDLTGGAFPYRPRVALQGALSVIATILLASLMAFALVMAFMIQAAKAAPPIDPVAGDLPPAGLFFNAGRDDALFEAPTLKSEVAIDLNGEVARVRVRQHYHNPASVWLEGIYVFPLPERSAVDRLVMIVGERRVEGRILEKAEAERVYRQAAADGRRASLLSSKRPNVFVISVANVAPGKEIVIEIEYQDRATYEDGRYSYRFPMVVAPRYTPGEAAPLVRMPLDSLAPDPKVQPIGHRGDETDQDLEPLPRSRDLFGPVRRPAEGLANPVSLVVALDAGLPIAELVSLTHAVEIEQRGAGRRLVTLAEQSVPADRDFVLEWRPAVGREPEATVFAEEIDGETYLLVGLLPPREPERDDDAGPTRPPRDLIFVVDTSGSMHGRSIVQARQAVLFALDRLAPGDRFNVIRFDSKTRSLFGALRPASDTNLRRARAYVRDLEAEGGTEMRPALDLALAETTVPGRLRQVVFLTDGAVSNEHDLFLTIAKRLGDIRLFTVGIGSAPNSYFMRKAAELGHGSFTYIGDPGEVSARMTGLLRKLERPALTDVAVSWPPAEGAELYPAALPDLYTDAPVSFTARLKGVPLNALQGELLLSGRRGAVPWRRKIRLTGARPAPGVAAIWGRAKFADIQDGRYRGDDSADLRRRAVAVALKHRLVTVHTSLVAVDEERARPEDQSLDSAEVPRNLPHGMDYAKIFGAGHEIMPLRTLPAPLMRKAAAQGQAVALPQTATPAVYLTLSGLALLLLGCTLLIAVGRIRRAGF